MLLVFLKSEIRVSLLLMACGRKVNPDVVGYFSPVVHAQKQCIEKNKGNLKKHTRLNRTF